MRKQFLLAALLVTAALALPASAQEVKIAPSAEPRMVSIGEDLVVNVTMVQYVRFRPATEAANGPGSVFVQFNNGMSESVRMTREQWHKVQDELVTATRK